MTSIPVQAFFRPLIPESREQQDPYLLVVPESAHTTYRYYIYTTSLDPEVAEGKAYPSYGSHDLVHWQPIGSVLEADSTRAYWAPCVQYIPSLAYPYVMLYSKAIGNGDEKRHIGHTIYRAHSKSPEGPFVDSGHVLTTDYDFAIDPDVYRLKDGSLKMAFAVDFTEDEPYGTGIVEATISEDLSQLLSEPVILARGKNEWNVFDPMRKMPWKTIKGVNWEQHTVKWYTIEGPVGGIISPNGRAVYLYSGGNFLKHYAIGAIVENDKGELVDITTQDANFVIQPQPDGNIYGPGHCSYFKALDGKDYIVLHARFGSPEAPRQMCIVPLLWTENGYPYTLPAKEWPVYDTAY